MAMRSSFAARVAGARPAVRASRPSARTVSVKAFKVTFQLPGGVTKEIECSGDTYLLDAAEVRLGLGTRDKDCSCILSRS